MTFTQQLLQFVIRHWVMCGAFVLLLVMIFIEEARSKGLGTQLTVQRVVDLMNHDQAVVLDLRDKSVFSEGHILGAMNIPKADLEQKMNKITPFKTRPIVVVCSNGQQSMQVAIKLRKQGFEKAQALSRGMQAWKNESMPTNKG